MHYLNSDLPKILLPLCGKTLLEWQMNMLSVLPVNRIILATHYKSIMIERNIKSYDGLHIYLSKSSRLLDTGGALKHVVEKYRPMSPITIVMNGDILCDVDLRKMFIKFVNSYECLMLTTYSNKASEYGSTKILDNRIISFNEKAITIKTSHINGGIYLLSSSTLNYLPEKTVFSLEYDVFPYIDMLYSYKHPGMWHDIGTPSRYKGAINDLNKTLRIRRLTMRSSGQLAAAA